MNRDFVLFHLREAADELARSIRELEKDAEYGSGQLLVAMQQIYHHANSAWNGQDVPALRAINVNDSTWNRLGEFPADFPLARV